MEVSISHNWTVTSLVAQIWLEVNGNSTYVAAAHRPIRFQKVDQDRLQKRVSPQDCFPGNLLTVPLNANGGGYYECVPKNQYAAEWMVYETNEWATENQFDSVDSDVGGEYAYSNGLKYLAADVTNSMHDSSWRRGCVEIYSSNNQLANGVVQFGDKDDHNNGLGDC